MGKHYRVCPLLSREQRYGEKIERQILLIFKTPHKFVTTQAVCRCIVEILSLSMTDKAHSTRSVSSFKARSSGISTKEFLKRRNWSKEFTFQIFYFRNVDN